MNTADLKPVDLHQQQEVPASIMFYEVESHVPLLEN